MSPAIRAKIERSFLANAQVTMISAKNGHGTRVASAIHLNIENEERLWLLCPAGLGIGVYEMRRLAESRAEAIRWLNLYKAEGTLLDHAHGRPLSGPIRVGCGSFVNGPTGHLILKDYNGSPVEVRAGVPHVVFDTTGDPGEITMSEEMEDPTMSTSKKAKAPKKPKTERKEDGLCTFAVRLEPVERDAIHKAAEAKEMSASAWVRDILSKAAARTNA